MRHFVQYHNVDEQGELSAGRLGIFTQKPIGTLLGDRVWLIAGRNKPRAYELCGSFLVSEIEVSADTGSNEAWGSGEMPLSPVVNITDCEWLPDLKKVTGNFAFGLTRLKSDRIIDGLIAATELLHQQLANPDSIGKSLFGNSDENRRIELAAVSAVAKKYATEGWHVCSHEKLNLGYDLYCERGGEIRCIEVKGTKGIICSFILTANEKEFLERSNVAMVAVVTNALDDRNCHVEEFQKKQIFSQFVLEPLSFAVRKRTE